MARSSSAIKIVDEVISKGSVTGNHRQQHPKLGAPRLAVELDNPTMIADDLGNQGKAKPRTIPLRGYERVEKMRLQILGNAGTVIHDRNHQRQMHTTIATRYSKLDAMLIGSGQRDLASLL